MHYWHIISFNLFTLLAAAIWVYKYSGKGSTDLAAAFVAGLIWWIVTLLSWLAYFIIN